MGNQKNKENPHVSRGRLKKNEKHRVPDRWDASGRSSESQSLRIVKLANLEKAIHETSVHAATCQACITNTPISNEAISLVGESSRSGLASVLTACCNSCGKEIIIPTSSKVSGQGGTKGGSVTLPQYGDR